MSAYHSPLWAQFYDIWVDTLFDPNVASQDVGVFLDQLRQVEAKLDGHETGKTLVVVEVGTGSGRVVRHLYKRLSLQITDSQTLTRKERDYVLIGTEPSTSMLEKARLFWRDFQSGCDEEPGSHSKAVEVFWDQASANNFGDHINRILPTISNSNDEASVGKEKIRPQNADIIIFAAGGVSHLVTKEDVKQFLSQVSEHLTSAGRAIISVLNDFFSPEKNFTPDPDVATHSSLGVGQQNVEPPQVTAQRVVHPGKDGRVFVRYPLSEQWDADHKVRTDKFRVTLENKNGIEEESAELEWQMRIVELAEWKKSIELAGLRLVDVISGDIQVWLVIEKT